MAPAFDLPPGSIVAVDRGYNHFRLFARWIARGVFFVTRPMHHIVYEVVESRPVPQNSNIISDQIIRLSSKMARQTFKHLLRRIVVWDAAQEREIVLLTNHFDFGATTIANIYKDRWEIELFFKALKQNLKIKSFVGTTENALHIQIWTALIAMLLLKWLHHLSQANWSLSNLATMLRLNLFTYRDLRDWLQESFRHAPDRSRTRTASTRTGMIWTGNTLMEPKPPPHLSIIPVLKPFLAVAGCWGTDYLGQQ